MRERLRTQGRGRKRGKRIPSRLCPDSSKPYVGLKLKNCEIVIGAEVGRSTDRATKAPRDGARGRGEKETERERKS